jgi:type II secretory pathway pseudopilin PulG
MNAKPNRQQRLRQRGFVAVLLIVMMAMAAVAAMTANLWGDGDSKTYEQKTTQDALRLAKQALLTYIETGQRTDLQANFWSAINGRLPCINIDGTGTAAGACGTGISTLTGVSSLGLFPWRTLDISTLRDGANECLWYAVSGDHKNGVVGSRTDPANADTNGLFTIIQPIKTVNPATGAVTWAQQVLAGNPDATVAESPDRVVAVIIAPGSARTGQIRSPKVPDVVGTFFPCGLPISGADGNPNAELSAIHYLEPYTNGAFAATNHSLTPSIPNTPRIFVQADKGQERLNDQLIWITAEEFGRAATRRTSRIFATAINNFVAANGFYPRPAAIAGGPCSTLGAGALLQGFMPFTCAGAGIVAPLNVGTRLNPTAPAAPALSPPATVRAYDLDFWLPQTHYAVSESCVMGAGGVIGGAACGGAARISANTGAISTTPAVLLMRGRPKLGQACLAGGNMSTCLEDPLNIATVNNALTLPPIATVTLPAVQYREPTASSNDYLVRFTHE